jgi:iron complex outermembrane recepter protein
VTGTHIRGSEPASPVIVSTRAQIEDSGQTDLGGYVRALPQNFANCGSAPKRNPIGVTVNH